MTIKNRIATLERIFGNLDGPCLDHKTTLVIRAGEPIPEESEIAPCPKCGRPGSVLVIKEIVVTCREEVET